MNDSLLVAANSIKLSAKLERSLNKDKVKLMNKKTNDSSLDFPTGSAAVVIIKNENKILAVSRKGDHEDLGLPGGKIEPGESPTTAACREAVEETGKIICNPRLMHVAKVGDICVFVFSADLIGHMSEHINSENAKVCWVNPEDICSGTFGKFNKKHIMQLL